MTEKLRIALIGSSRFPIRQPFAGGLEAHVWHLARALAARDHEVSIFAAAGSDPGLDCSTLKVETLRMSASARQDSSMTPATFMAEHHAYLSLMMQLSDGARDDFDIIHNHSLHYLPVAMAPMLATPMLTTMHTPPTPWLESAIGVSGGVGTDFAAVSEHTAGAWRAAVGDISVVPNGIDTGRWPLGPGGGPLAWLGRITGEKAPHLAIAAARQAGWPLILAGPVSDSAYFADLVEPQLDDRIRYAGHLDQNQLARLVGRATALLVTPVWDEPYGLVVAEAMCCGTPVIAFARGGIPELVGAQAGRLVPPGDVASMAAAVPEVATLPRAGVRDHALRYCSSESMLRVYLSMYRDMIEKRGSDNDRLLHPPSGLRSSRTGREHLQSTSHSGHGTDVPRHSGAESVRGGSELSA